MSMMKDHDRERVSKAFEALEHDVRIVMFTQESECQFCEVARELVEEVASLSGNITLEVHDFVKDEEKVRRYGIDKIPALVIEGEKDYGIRFYGVPAGYEFTTLIEDIIRVGRREHGLPETVTAELAKVAGPVHMQVMVSPTCPYCPRAVLTAHRMAMASDHVTADMVEISEFPHLAVKYGVQGVPRTIINETVSIEGAAPEMEVVKKVLEAAGAGADTPDIPIR